MNNYQPVGSLGNLIGTGVNFIPAAGSDDAKLLAQQNVYALKCQQYVANITRVDGSGKNISKEAQRAYLTLIANTPMTLAAAQSYAPNVTPVFWTTGVVDYFLAYNTITTTPF